MFGIGGGELILILFVVLMLFGSDKIPDIARTMGKAMAQLKNATNDIKSEIQKGAEANGIDSKSITDITGNINQEISKAKENLLNEDALDIENPKIVIENLETTENEGPIKRQS
jgi:sec-independent protein translocase protein TatA